MNLSNIVVILACGRGSRFSIDKPKQYFDFYGNMLLRHTIMKFVSYKKINAIAVVINQEDIDLYNDATNDLDLLPYIIGGETRQDSAKLAMLALEKYKPKNVLIHDACRPFFTHEILDKLLYYSNSDFDCVFPAIAINDTIRHFSEDGFFHNIDRKEKFYIQTPQLLNFNTGLSIFKQENDKLDNFSDESSLFLAHNKKIKMIEGDVMNIKITTKSDYKMADIIFKAQKENRIGIGYDTHKFISSNDQESYIILGGVKIEYEKKIEAHSDGDVLIHAVVDALLGAACLGDIGEYFPPSDEYWRNADSSFFLETINDEIKKNGGIIINIDIVIICEEPKITPYKISIRNNLSKILGIDITRISVKATTNEKMGFVGRKEGIIVQAIANILI